MLESHVLHALGLHRHQPPGDLALVIEGDVGEAPTTGKPKVARRAPK